MRDDQFTRLYERRKKQELDGLTGMDAEQADWEEGLDDEDAVPPSPPQARMAD